MEQIFACLALPDTHIVSLVLKIIVGFANQNILLLCSQVHIIYQILKVDSHHQSLDAYRVQYMVANFVVIESI